MKWFIITSLLILTILGSTGLAIEEHVLMLAGQEVRFTAVPEEGYILKDKDGRMKARHGVAESEDAKVSYRAPLFSVNGQKVGVTPEVVVRVTSETSRKELDSLCTRTGLRLLRPMPFTTQEYVLEVIGPDAGAVFAAVQTLNQTDGVEWAWPNLILYRDPEPIPEPIGDFEDSLSLASATESNSDVPDSNTLIQPNDPLFPNQWHLHNTGQEGGTPGADVNTLAAWEITTGDPNIVVAVLDSGVDMVRPD